MSNINKLFKSIFQGEKENADRVFNQIMAEKLTQAKEIRKVGLTAEIFNNNTVTESLSEATSADLKKVLDAAKKAGGDVSGNTIDFGEGSVIKVSIEKGKIKFDGGKSSDTEYFDSVKDAMMAFESVNEKSLSEAVSADKFVKGGNDKITQSDVDDLLGNIYDSSSLTKSLVRNKAYQEGEDNPKGTNPYKKDTFDYHLFLLGQQMEKSRS